MLFQKNTSFLVSRLPSNSAQKVHHQRRLGSQKARYEILNEIDDCDHFFDSNVLFPCLDVEVEMPDTLDLATLRGQGLQSSEEELPEGTPPVVPGRV